VGAFCGRFLLEMQFGNIFSRLFVEFGWRFCQVLIRDFEFSLEFSLIQRCFSLNLVCAILFGDLTPCICFVCIFGPSNAQGPETLREVAFQQAFGRDLQEAHEWCKKFTRSGKDSDLNQAWELYYHVFRRINKQVRCRIEESVIRNKTSSVSLSCS
jgi:hypothetical protein